MTERVMNNVNEKLSKSREMCAGMSEDVYALTDYMSKVANDTLVPQGLALCLALVLDDIQKGRNGFACAESKELPKYLVEHKNQVLNQAVYIPQVIDAIADKEFAEEFRAICEETFGFNPPKRVNAELKGEYPEYVKVAVDWWANAVAAPKLDNGGDMPSFLFTMAANSGKTHSEEEIAIFKATLAEEIIKSMERRNSCELSVDYHPCCSLAMAGDKIGIDSMMGYPWKTYMRITESEVKVSSGYGAGYETLWTSN